MAWSKAMTATTNSPWPAEPTAWQLDLLDRLLALPPGARLTPDIAVGRRNGKALADRFAINAACAFGLHVHVVGRDGLWCVNGTDIGPLWERLR